MGTVQSLDPGDGHFFGSGLDLDGTTLVAGALGAGSDGAAYVFERDFGGGSAYGQVAKLAARNGANNDAFGYRVAICGDTVVVGAPNDTNSGLYEAGSALVFERDQVGAIEALATDVAGGVVYGIDVIADELVRIEPTSPGSPVAVYLGELDYERVRGLAFDPNTSTLYGVDEVAAALLRIDTETGAGTLIGHHGLGLISGLAFDAVNGVLYGSDTTSDELVRIDPATGAGTVVGPLGFQRVRGLAFDAVGAELYGSDTDTGQLIRIDPLTGAGTAVGPLGSDPVEALAPSAIGGELLGIELQPSRLLGIDPALAGNPVIHVNRVGAENGWGEVARLLASDASKQAWFGISVAIDGDTIVVGAAGDSFETGAAYVFERGLGGKDAWGERAKLTASDGRDGDLFGVVAIHGDTVLVGAPRRLFTTSGAAYIFDRNFGGANAWGEERVLKPGFPGSPFDNFGSGVALDADRALVGAADDGNGAAYVYDRTGTFGGTWVYAAKLTAPGGNPLDKFGQSVDFAGPNLVVGAWGTSNGGTAYAFDSSFNLLAQWSPPGVLPTDDFGSTVTASGGIVAVGDTGHDQPESEAGRVIVYALSESSGYCTAGTSASGCVPSLQAAGIPSASSASGFALITQGVEGARDGLYFFGANGRQANPWGDGTSFQCIAPPVKRAGLLASTGTDGQCNGGFSQDLNAYWCPTCPAAHKNPGPGAVVQAQLWYRDPQNPSNQPTSLSAAVEFVLQP